MRRGFIIVSIILIFAITILLIRHWGWHTWLLAALIIPFLALGFIDYFHKTDNIRRQYPLFGRLSRLMEEQRHVIQEVVLQNSTEGEPFTLVQRKIVYKRANDELMNFAFGTEVDYHQPGREWLKHSAFPLKSNESDIRIEVGGNECKQPYSSSILNIGGMSFGSISSKATMALSGGAAIGNFALNTGEGGLTPYHEKYDADLIFQIGTGYFGCRDDDGNFNEGLFEEVATKAQVKMIEIKISQGAKPGFGAILPASKNTTEIAEYRKIEPHEEVHSPAYHSAFGSPSELMSFIKKLRRLSRGKPIGIKLCLGNVDDFREICKVAKSKGDGPDFIAIDGGEGGTGAGSIDAIHWVGKPIKKALPIIHQILQEEGIREEVKVFASGKVISSFDILTMKALGADACYSARGMMFALGCVQSLKCNKNTCPTGITTVNSDRVKALVVKDKKVKVANYHRNTVRGVNKLLAATGLSRFDQVSSDVLEEFTPERKVMKSN